MQKTNNFVHVSCFSGFSGQYITWRSSLTVVVVVVAICQVFVGVFTPVKSTGHVQRRGWEERIHCKLAQHHSRVRLSWSYMLVVLVVYLPVPTRIWKDILGSLWLLNVYEPVFFYFYWMCKYKDEYWSRLTFFRFDWFSGRWNVCRHATTIHSPPPRFQGPHRLHRKKCAWYVKSVFLIHVGGTRCVTSSTDNIMKIQARITLTVEFIRTVFFYFYFMVEYNYEYDQY